MRTAVILLLSICSASADVRLPSFFSDHMVLQRQKPIRIWGWAAPGEKVSVKLGDAQTAENADREGLWRVTLPAREASAEPLTLTVTSGNTVEVKDILIGEVWLCSGQSNMEWSVARSKDAAQEIAAANYPLIRHMKAPRTPSFVPLDDVKTKWDICSPDTAGNFTACGYYMARELHKQLNVPIGLVNSSWGGTRVEPWTPPVGFEGVKELDSIYSSLMTRTPGTDAYQKAMGGFLTQTSDWLATAQTNFANSESIAPSPGFPAELKPFTSHQDPTMLYNGMIHGLVGFPIRGAIWYQGESNHTEGSVYTAKKKALIEGWRKLWDLGDFHFHFVQIAPFQYGSEAGNVLAEFWEAQEAVLQIPNTGMVVINDIATLNNIHPPNKQDVGLRLANLALKNCYERNDIVAESPRMKDVASTGSSLNVVFQNTGGGLKTRDGKPPTHFEIIGPGAGGFHPAKAEIDGDTVRLTSQKVPQPTAFRFAWDKLAEPNLTGATGLPVGAVRGGEMPEFSSQIPLGDFKLVYDLNLLKLSESPEYEVDNSASIGTFDRIGYLVELTSDEIGDRRIWVTLDPFTKDASKIGLPTAASKASFQQKVKNLNVMASGIDLGPAGNRTTGNIEFWPNNYGANNEARIPGASGTAYDFGDGKGDPVNGYGSMQIHDYGQRTTLFAINHWNAEAKADLGIGNSGKQHPDWTFSGNASDHKSARLRVFVREVK